MTGYATASAGPAGEAPSAARGDSPGAVGRAAVTIEMRSVNGRFLDLALRLPDELRAIEPALRELVAGGVRRGKVELRASTAREASDAWPQPGPEQLARLAHLETTVRAWLPQAAPLSVHEALGWCRGGASAAALEAPALQAAQRCLISLREARAREGARLADALRERVARLRRLAADAGPLVPATVQRQQQRFLDRWREALEAGGGANGASPDSLRERALGEATAFALRIDIAEELSRLVSHLDEIERLLERGGEVGKRLDFLIQELLREANTLGSKAAAIELTNIAVEMKVAIEQLREQVQNIE